MFRFFLLASLALAAVWLVSPDSAKAASPLVETVSAHLYSGQTEKAAMVAEARLQEVPGDDNARFALGAIQFLQAVEQLGQSLHRYGLQSTYQDRTGLTGLPILRLPVPDNPNPDELTYEVLRNVLQKFVANLETAESTLSKIKSRDVDLPLNIGLIRLDLNGDGKGGENESFWRIFAAVTNAGGWLNQETSKQLLTDFDSSDVPWLRAYCHLLIAIAEFPLAHDWQNAFDLTFPGIFRVAQLPETRKLHHTVAEARARLAKLPPYPPRPPKPPNLSHSEWIRTKEYRLWEVESRRITALRAEATRKLLPYDIADAIAFVHLMKWPVVEPERMANALRHLESVVGLSRENWKSILAETDNRNEWIPSPAQSGVLPGMPITQDHIDGWQKSLDEFEAILEGTKLIPHWRFAEGVNLRRMFLEQRTFDIVLLIHGSAVLPYLEGGPLSDQETWRQISVLLGGDFFRYSIWFN